MEKLDKILGGLSEENKRKLAEVATKKLEETEALKTKKEDIQKELEALRTEYAKQDEEIRKLRELIEALPDDEETVAPEIVINEMPSEVKGLEADEITGKETSSYVENIVPKLKNEDLKIGTMITLRGQVGYEDGLAVGDSIHNPGAALIDLRGGYGVLGIGEVIFEKNNYKIVRRPDLNLDYYTIAQGVYDAAVRNGYAAITFAVPKNSLGKGTLEKIKTKIVEYLESIQSDNKKIDDEKKIKKLDEELSGETSVIRKMILEAVNNIQEETKEGLDPKVEELIDNLKIGINSTISNDVPGHGPINDSDFEVSDTRGFVRSSDMGRKSRIYIHPLKIDEASANVYPLNPLYSYMRERKEEENDPYFIYIYPNSTDARGSNFSVFVKFDEENKNILNTTVLEKFKEKLDLYVKTNIFTEYGKFKEGVDRKMYEGKIIREIKAESKRILEEVILENKDIKEKYPKFIPYTIEEIEGMKRNNSNVLISEKDIIDRYPEIKKEDSSDRTLISINYSFEETITGEKENFWSKIGVGDKTKIKGEVEVYKISSLQANEEYSVDKEIKDKKEMLEMVNNSAKFHYLRIIQKLEVSNQKSQIATTDNPTETGDLELSEGVAKETKTNTEENKNATNSEMKKALEEVDVTVEDYIEAHKKLITEFGIDNARKNPEKTLETARKEVKGIFAYMEGKLTAKEVLCGGPNWESNQFGFNLRHDSTNEEAEEHMQTFYSHYIKMYNDIKEKFKNNPQVEQENKENIKFSDLDEKFEDAAKIIVGQQHASTSLIQRKMQLGFSRATRIMHQMAQLGIVGPAQGSKPREVLIYSVAELEEFLKNLKHK
ncbi:MAG: DNA translocase FtsK [Candidatus Paceibacterota bacterium]